MFHIVLFEPEIPPNTGNIIRLASNTGSRLHLLKPLGFTLEDRKLRRAGLDYHEFSHVQVHDGWDALLGYKDENDPGARLYAFSTKGKESYAAAAYRPGDYLLFGPETRGLPEEIRESRAVSEVLRIPMQPHSRSLNLANAAAVVVYEAWRQNRFG